MAFYLVDIRITKKCFWALQKRGIIKIDVPNSNKNLTEKNQILQTGSQTNIINTEIDLTPDNGIYSDIWMKLTKEWKELIISKIPKRIDPEMDLPFGNNYLPDFSLNGPLNNDEAIILRDFFLTKTYIETGSKITDLNPIINFSNLECLIIGGYYSGGGNYGNKNINSLAPLKQLTKLKKLNCQSSSVSDLTPISNFEFIEELNINHTNIKSLDPIKNFFNLKELKFTCAPIIDISPLSNFLKLKTLEFGCNNSSISNIAVLSNLNKLKTLYISSNPITNIEPIRNLSKLKYLHLSRTHILNLEPLSELFKLEVLWISETNVRSLLPLKNLVNLVRLDFDKTPITNIEPILNLPNLRMIDCDDSVLPIEQINKLKLGFPQVRIETTKKRKRLFGIF